MQKKQVAVFNNEDRKLSLRTQELVSHLETLWKKPSQSPQPSPEMFKRIIEFLSQLPDSYQTLGMTKIAEYFASAIGLHFINLMAKFQEKSKLEGMAEEEITATLEGALTEFFPEMMRISKQIVARSLDDLVISSNITFGLYNLSQTDTAEDTQSWIYELPTLYLRYLSQEHLMTNVQDRFIVVVYPVLPAKMPRRVSSWKGYSANSVTISTTERKGLTIE